MCFYTRHKEEMKFLHPTLTWRELSTAAIWVRNKTSPHTLQETIFDRRDGLLRILTQGGGELPSDVSAQRQSLFSPFCTYTLSNLRHSPNYLFGKQVSKRRLSRWEMAIFLEKLQRWRTYVYVPPVLTQELQDIHCENVGSLTGRWSPLKQMRGDSCRMS